MSRTFQVAHAVVTTVTLALNQNPVFFSEIVTGDLTKPVVHTDPNHDKCIATGSDPLPFTSQAPQFCLVVSGQTKNRCCTPSHDSYIKETMDGLWPKECSNDDHEQLDLLSCLSCSAKQPIYTDRARKVVRVCESVLREIYGQDDLKKPTNEYEKCGAWSSPDTIVTPVDPNDWSKGYVLSSDDSVLIYPQNEYKDASEFFANFPPISIPFMEDYSI